MVFPPTHELFMIDKSLFFRKIGRRLSRSCTGLGICKESLYRAGSSDFSDEWSVPGNGPHVVVLDHQDSFTYNLVQSLSESGAHITVRQADRRTLTEIVELKPDRILLSPGPGKPESAHLARTVFEHFRGQIPLLGVCLGHQVMALSLGAQVVPSGSPVHGKSDLVRHIGRGIFEGLPHPMTVARYHSLHVVPESLPSEVAIVAWSDSGGIMGFTIRDEPTWGVQFHPESFLTPEGDRLLKTFVKDRCCPEGLPRLGADDWRSDDSQPRSTQLEGQNS